MSRVCRQCLYLTILVATFQARNVRSESNFFNFDEIKKNLFTINGAVSEDCSRELTKIYSGLASHETWAMKLVDSWGKMPSGIFSGNWHEFGAFSQCFSIERKDSMYKTQYCLGHVLFNGSDWVARHETIHRNAQKVNAPNLFRTQKIGHALPQFDVGPGLTFGVCLPAACSTGPFEKVLNKIIQAKIYNASFSLPKYTCQHEENLSELTTLDKVAVIFLGIVTVLILASTAYDILHRVYQREGSAVLLAFSFYTNGTKLLSCKENKSADVMQCLHGIRAISTQWVVLGHTFLMFVLMPIRNLSVVPEFMSQYHSMLIMSAPIAVDTFFVISGLLVSVNMLKSLEKSRGKMNILYLYLHRYVRLTPLLAVCVLLTASVLKFLGSGPLWPTMTGFFDEQCEQNWWKTLLYIQNYANPSDICLGHTWYLAVDTQLFVIAPVLVYLIYWFRTKVFLVFVPLVLGCIGCTLATHLKYDITNLLQERAMEISYFPTHLRFGSWLVGLMAGYFFYEARTKAVRIPRIVNIIAWMLSLSAMTIVIFVNYPLQQLDTKAGPLEFGLYDSLSRVIWSIALCYIIFACVHNYGGPINSFLGHPLWQPLSRLSYSMYLVHLLVLMVTTASLKSSLYFSELNAFQTFLGNYMLSVFVSIIATLAFESPIIALEKVIFGTKNKPQPIITYDQHEHFIHQNISYESLENSI